VGFGAVNGVSKSEFQLPQSYLKSKALDAARKPLGATSLSELRTAAAIPPAQVPASVDA
jgi:hypothetical protein